MITYYAKKSLEILIEEGGRELFSRVANQFLPREYVIKINTNINLLINKTRWDAVSDPYKICYINPEKVKYQNLHKFSKIKSGLGSVNSEDWDKEPNLRLIDDHPKMQAIRQRYEEGKDWNETVYVEYSEEKLQNHGELFPYSNIDELIDTKCRHIDNLYNSMKSDGYVVDCSASDMEKSADKVFDSMDRYEVLICIDRDGNFQFAGGYHRFCVASVLNLDIAAQVACRHEQWQELRDEIYNNGLPEGREDLRDHPDLQDLIDE
jgi:hypothetical protein